MSGVRRDRFAAAKSARLVRLGVPMIFGRYLLPYFVLEDQLLSTILGEQAPFSLISSDPILGVE